MVSDDSGNQSENDEINKVQTWLNRMRKSHDGNSFDEESQNDVNIQDN